MHYQRARNGSNLSAPAQVAFSKVEYPYCFHPNCDRKRDKTGRYCKLHYQRSKTGVDMDRAPRTGVGEWVLDRNGYVNRRVRIKVNGRWTKQSQHREVMAEKIGRPLLPHENVHHINGVRHDNRPENLELWSKSQPAGQRAIDKLAWAREIIALYAGHEDEIS